MSATMMTLESGYKIEQFLYREAELLDAWRLDEWLSLFSPNAIYSVPATVGAGTTAEVALWLIDDDYGRLVGRVQRLLNRRAHASNPRPRTRHLVSNVRPLTVTDGSGGWQVHANFIIYSMRNRETNVLMGEYRYRLQSSPEGEFTIEEKRAVLDMETLGPAGGKINFVI